MQQTNRFGRHALDFIKDIVGHRIVESIGEKRSTSYPMQTIGMAMYSAGKQQFYIRNCIGLQEVGTHTSTLQLI